MNLSLLYICVCVPPEAKKGCQIPMGNTWLSAIQHVCWELNSNLLQELQALLMLSHLSSLTTALRTQVICGRSCTTQYRQESSPETKVNLHSCVISVANAGGWTETPLYKWDKTYTTASF